MFPRKLHPRLSDEALQHAYQILGKRPLHNAERTKVSNATTACDPQSPCHSAKNTPLNKVALPHFEAKLLYEKHLEMTKQRKRSLKPQLLKRLREENLTMPDFVLGDTSLRELVLLRSELT